jgi:hypothetical protein
MIEKNLDKVIGIRLAYNSEGNPISFAYVDVDDPNNDEFLIKTDNEHYLITKNGLWKFIYSLIKRDREPPRHDAIYVYVDTRDSTAEYGWWWIPVDEIE